MIPSHAVSRLDAAATNGVSLHARRPRRGGERGAVLVHATVAIMALLAFSALTIDLGTLWVSRAQAQNAVDAAALSGGVSLAYVNPDDTDAAMAAARTIAQEHSIWGEPIPSGALQMTPGPCPIGSPAIPGDCLNVAVQPGSGGSRPLPVFFSRLIGGGATSLRASASVKVMNGNTSSCVRPLAIMDSWQAGTGSWTFDDRFAPPDTYVPPSASSHGTGHTGASLNLRVHLGRGGMGPNGALDPPAGNEYFNLDISRVDSPNGQGSYDEREARYLANMASCNGVPVEIGESVSYWDEGHEEVNAAAQALIDTDPGAYWDGTTIRGSAFQVSPRLLTIALIDPHFYVTQQTLPIEDRRYLIRNLVGFFLEDTHSPMAGLSDPLVGVLLRTHGVFTSNADTVAPESAFLKSVALVR
jgi:hypothetical protein